MKTGWFFYLEKGKAKGPIEKDQIEAAIQRGKLGPFDLVYREGSEKWLPLHQFRDFKPLFKSTIKAEIEDSWVVLVRTESKKGVTYLQRGPFDTDKVKKLLQAGEVRYRDFIWREGQSQWSRISSHEEFSPPAPEWKPSHKLPHDVGEFKDQRTKEEIFQEVVIRPPAELTDEEIPLEVEARDLTLQKDAPKPAVERVERAPSRSERRVRTAAVTGTRSRRREHTSALIQIPTSMGLRQMPLLWVAAALGVMLVSGILYSNRHEIAKAFKIEVPAPEEERITPAQPPPVQAAPVAVEKPQVKAAAPPPAPQPPRIDPTRLAARLTQAGTPRAALNFDTDASFHFPIRVQIFGAAGQILGSVSVYRDVTIRKSKEGEAKLELSALNLGEGSYALEARVKDVGAALKFRIGRDNKAFRAKLERHRKLISLPFQRERRRLIRATIDLQNIARAGARNGFRRWNESLHKWAEEQLEGLNLKNPKSLVFPAEWTDLVDVRDELKRIGSAVSPDAKEFRAAEERLHVQVERAQELSLYR